MTISTYSELKAAVADWMARSDISGNVADFITLAEARLNRLLGPVGTTANLTGIIGAQTLDISSLSVQEPQNLYVSEGVSDYFVVPRALGTYSTTTAQGRPTMWAIEGDTITFDRPMISAYAFRFVYLGRFALSDSAPTNEFLTNHPDLYLAAAMVWGCGYVKDQSGGVWKQMLDEFTAEVASDSARKKRSQLTVDPGLGSIGRYRYNSTVDSSL
ncbi:phage adaptor protein [Rhizobium mesoamericanum]|uniref:Uncharacterized protein n=1 Tax=Rhizobium mesoamericanum STM3625 TaxID=1211777 RepID=K0PTH2_9HYPH|nr:hypothetical protein [Rhizobium mesoamericanum]CCM77123.1 hypothetical protein BN77_4171 [Rhizobium mesoamericanum STM3625]